MNTKKIVTYGILIAVAMILSYLESLIPPLVAVYGIKLGLTNIVVIVALYLMGTKSALLINIIRVLLVGLLFGNLLSLLYSVAGALLSWVVMVLLKRSGRFKVVTVSIAGGVFHNIGQIIVAMLVLNTINVAWYLLVLWASGIAAGAVIGIISGLLCKKLKKIIPYTGNAALTAENRDNKPNNISKEAG